MGKQKKNKKNTITQSASSGYRRSKMSSSTSKRASAFQNLKSLKKSKYIWTIFLHFREYNACRKALQYINLLPVCTNSVETVTFSPICMFYKAACRAFFFYLLTFDLDRECSLTLMCLIKGYALLLISEKKVRDIYV